MLENAVKIVQEGGVIAYPTEAVFGLGCDPYNETAVKCLLALKKRDVAKGLILIASDWQQIEDLILPIPDVVLARIKATWPGPITWLFPASTNAPRWICGVHDTIALRIPDHTLARELCARLKQPIVSTSANLEGQAPARDALQVQKAFPQGIDMIIDAPVGSERNPSEIREALSGKVIRPR